MIFEDFINDIKAISKIANDEDIRDIVSHVDFIEKKLNKIANKNKDKMYSLLEDAIDYFIPVGYIIDMTAKADLGYRIADACELFDGDYDCNGYVYEFLDDNNIYVITNGKGFVKLIKWDDMVKGEQWKHVINKLAHNYELILNNPDIEDLYKEPIRKIENLFKVFGVKEKV